MLRHEVQGKEMILRFAQRLLLNDSEKGQIYRKILRFEDDLVTLEDGTATIIQVENGNQIVLEVNQGELVVVTIQYIVSKDHFLEII
ncbi:hypothetical protein [Litchfieldia alkalitelluris]|uniref:hypothetical protein n=1 Tax=Litchfieldia alkalitelluris TaxID=304268 RepID=UPI000997294B|nr:hypothetical protein [Litchfieldia alkalitelluris]